MPENKTRVGFVKMQALGNDFIFLNGVARNISLSEAKIRQLADRDKGIGCDQILICDPPSDMAADFFMRVYNADGSASEQCGNGARCFMHYVQSQQLTGKDEIVLQTATRNLRLNLVSLGAASKANGGEGGDAFPKDGVVGCVMGKVGFAPEAVFNSDFLAQAGTADASMNDQLLSYSIEMNDGTRLDLYAAEVGNPHLLGFAADLAAAEELIDKYGQLLSQHDTLLNGANIGFLVPQAEDSLLLRTYERGAGKTLACGSNATAAYGLARVLGRVGDKAELAMPGGSALMEMRAGEVSMQSVVQEEFRDFIELD